MREADHEAVSMMSGISELVNQPFLELRPYIMEIKLINGISPVIFYSLIWN